MLYPAYFDDVAGFNFFWQNYASSAVNWQMAHWSRTLKMGGKHDFSAISQCFCGNTMLPPSSIFTPTFKLKVFGSGKYFFSISPKRTD